MTRNELEHFIKHQQKEAKFASKVAAYMLAHGKVSKALCYQARASHWAYAARENLLCLVSCGEA